MLDYFYYSVGLEAWILAKYRLGRLLGNNYMAVRQEFHYILGHTKRASSLVENLNSS